MHVSFNKGTVKFYRKSFNACIEPSSSKHGYLEKPIKHNFKDRFPRYVLSVTQIVVMFFV